MSSAYSAFLFLWFSLPLKYQDLTIWQKHLYLLPRLVPCVDDDFYFDCRGGFRFGNLKNIVNFVTTLRTVLLFTFHCNVCRMWISFWLCLCLFSASLCYMSSIFTIKAFLVNQIIYLSNGFQHNRNKQYFFLDVTWKHLCYHYSFLKIALLDGWF